jgi:flagellar hook-associated protein 1 FlgK
MGGLLSIGQSGVQAAQAALNTTGHNIANASTPGYSRQLVVQSASQATNAGFGYVGTGTQVAEIKRVYNDFLANQVVNAQSSNSALSSYATHVSQIDNLLADSTSGLSPALQDFFKGVQDLSSNPQSVASRQAVLSSADSLAARFQGLDGRLNEIRQGVNSQITSSVTVINSYAQQIGKLNDSIAILSSNDQKPPNDLLDQRDQLVLDLNKEVKATVVKQNDSTYTVSIGNGQPLVVGSTVFKLAAAAAPTDLNRTEVGYVINGAVSILPENALTGGNLGGLFQFRSESLDVAQNSLGRVAVGLATTFNDQHKLGQDLNGVLGTDFFNAAVPVTTASIYNKGNSVTTASIVNASLLTASDYELKFDGVNYNVTRLSDSKVLSNTTLAAAHTAVQGEGIDFTLTAGTTPIAAGDNFLIKPTTYGATLFSVALTDRANIAAASPITTATTAGNTGNGKITPGFIDASYLPANGGTPIIAPANVTLTYDSATGSLSGFPPGQDVTVTTNGVAVVNTAPVASLPYSAGSQLSLGGVNVTLTGAPANNDSFVISQNVSGVGDNRNALALGGLQAATTLDNSTATYQGAYAELVSFVGNKTRELQVNTSASNTFLSQAKQAQASESGVNLDEEAANLLRYQQAYQASGKVVQIASQLFDFLLTLGGR